MYTNLFVYGWRIVSYMYELQCSTRSVALSRCRPAMRIFFVCAGALAARARIHFIRILIGGIVGANDRGNGRITSVSFYVYCVARFCDVTSFMWINAICKYRKKNICMYLCFMLEENIFLVLLLCRIEFIYWVSE